MMPGSRRIGDREVSAVGYGALQLSVEGRPPEREGLAMLRAVFDSGTTLIDTADSYCMNQEEVGHNERLVRRALEEWSGDRGQIMVATKGGHYRPGDGSWQVDGRPAALRAACERSMRALGVDVIDLYQFHRPDPEVPFAESIGAFRDLREAGMVRLVGISNVSVEQIAEARQIVEISSVQNEFSPDFWSSSQELGLCSSLDIAFIAYGPLGGRNGARRIGDRHPVLASIANDHGVSPQRVALAWELAQSKKVIVIPGGRSVAPFLDDVEAGSMLLSEEEMAAIAGAVSRRASVTGYLEPGDELSAGSPPPGAASN